MRVCLADVLNVVMHKSAFDDAVHYLGGSDNPRNPPPKSHRSKIQKISLKLKKAECDASDGTQNARREYAAYAIGVQG